MTAKLRAVLHDHCGGATAVDITLDDADFEIYRFEEVWVAINKLLILPHCPIELKEFWLKASIDQENFETCAIWRTGVRFYQSHRGRTSTDSQKFPTLAISSNRNQLKNIKLEMRKFQIQYFPRTRFHFLLISKIKNESLLLP